MRYMFNYNLIIFFIFLLLFLGGCGKLADDNPWKYVQKKPYKTTHTNLFNNVSKFEDGQSVTKECLRCHPQSAKEVMKTSHWTWLGEPEIVAGHNEPIRHGKRNAINNYCISIEGNWPKCTSCHAGYGWKDANFDFTKEENVDCLVCHDQTGTYEKGNAGNPAEGVDLLLVAKSVGTPSRGNCGYCHFNGGGGNAVKHGDLDGSLAKPVERIDVHMGRYDFSCIDCHKTKNHFISGRMMSVSINNTIAVKCTQCHLEFPHTSDRINEHIKSVSCQACHIPEIAIKEETKVVWDWSTAGKDVSINDPHKYLKIKGSFIYAKRLTPQYYWFNGNSTRYIKGDKINEGGITHLNYPLGGIEDVNSKIWPFKVHIAKQHYDLEYKYLLIPKNVGEGGFWTEFNWDKALYLGSEASGLKFSGKLGFTETDMHWVLSHMIAPKERALQCIDCHSENGRINWKNLGYDNDPAFSGGRFTRNFVKIDKEL